MVAGEVRPPTVRIGFNFVRKIQSSEAVLDLPKVFAWVWFDHAASSPKFLHLLQAG